MKLKVMILSALLVAISLTACKNSPPPETSVNSVEEQSIITSSIPENTQLEEQSTVSEISVEEKSENDFFNMDTGKSTVESSQIIEDESSQLVEVAEYEYAENELRGGIKITKYNGTNKEVLIPSVIDGLTVTSIGDNAFDGNEEITSVTIPNTVLDIEIEAFSKCINLTNVVFEDNSQLERIFTGAFGETGITEFTVPTNCKRIGDSFFGSNITKLTVLGMETQFAKDFAFSSLDVLVYFPRGSEAQKFITLHTPYNWKYLDEE